MKFSLRSRTVEVQPFSGPHVFMERGISSFFSALCPTRSDHTRAVALLWHGGSSKTLKVELGDAVGVSGSYPQLL